MKTLIDDIIHDRRTDTATLPLRFVLRILTVLYGMFVAVRNFLYNKGVFKTRDVPCRVISIGNITVGGTGKTPVVIMTARLLLERGYTVAVVSRGYRRQGREPLIVSDGASITSSPIEAGDEPHIIASSLPGVPVIVDTDRVRAAQLAYKKFNPRVVLLDDGFQHRRLYRNVDIVTLDAHNLYGNEQLLPRGILRESPYSLARAKAIIVTRYHDGLKRESIERMIRFYARTAPLFWSGHIPSGLRQMGMTESEGATGGVASPVSPGDINGVRVAALSNIAGPGYFRHTLADLGADIVLHRIMDDHHRYTADELDGIQRESLDAGAGLLVMTAKDERNLPSGYRFKEIRAYVLDIEAALLENIDDFIGIIEPYKK